VLDTSLLVPTYVDDDKMQKHSESAMFADTFYRSLREAMAETQRRRSEAQSEQLITRVEQSPYGGYRVRSIPAEFVLDHMADHGSVPMPRSGRDKLVA
jgi:hypothetical protein